MKEILNNEEILLARDIINIALAHASVALTKMTKQEFQMQNVVIEEKIGNKLTLDKKLNEDLIVLSSPIKGEIDAECFLIFNHEEAYALSSVLLPNYQEKSAKIHEAMLLEIDNILTASVVTQFSNFLGIRIFGQIPHLSKLNTLEAEQFINSKANLHEYHFTVETNFITKKVRFHPKFVWIFNKHFLSFFKKLSQNTNAHNSINEKKAFVDKYIIN